MLWTLVGPHWRHPIIAEPSSGTDILKANLTPIPTLAKQKLAVEAFLTERSINHNEQGWFLMKNVLLNCALPSDGKDPEDCVSWTPSVIEGETAEGVLRGMDGYFERASGSGWGSVAALKTIYWKFCLWMLEQLVFRKQPIDLVWCKLHSIPFRKNWLQVLMQMDMAKSSKWVESKLNWRTVYRRKFPTNDKKAMLKRGLPDLLMDTHLQGIESRQTRLSRSIEVELTPLFWDNLRYAESLPSYPGKLRGRAEEIINKQNTILALYIAFVEESKHPFVLISGNRLPQSGQGKWCGNQNLTRRYWPISDLDTVYDSTEETESVEGSLVDPNVELREMSDLPPQGSDVRPSDNHLEENILCVGGTG